MKKESGASHRVANELYRIALLLSESEEVAQRMVVDAFASGSIDATSGAPPKLNLIRALLENRPAEDVLEAQSTPVRVRLARRILDANFPVAFASLATDEQLVLLLVHVDGLSDMQVETLLDLQPGHYEVELQGATSHVVQLFLESLSTTERGLILDCDPDEWIHDAVRAVATNLFAPAPTVLLDQIVDHHGNASDDASAVDGAEAQAGQLDVRRTLAVGVLLAAVLFASLWWLTTDTPDAHRPRDLLQLTVDEAQNVKQELQGNSEQAAEQFIFERTDQQVVVPRFTDSELTGAAIQNLDTDISVPVLTYIDRQSGLELPFSVFVYAYRMLGQSGDGPRIAAAVLRSLDEEISFTFAPVGTDTLLVWRHRTNIYVAVGESRTINSLDDRTELQLPLGSR